MHRIQAVDCLLPENVEVVRSTRPQESEPRRKIHANVEVVENMIQTHATPDTYKSILVTPEKRNQQFRYSLALSLLHMLATLPADQVPL